MPLNLMDRGKVLAFLTELSALTQHYGIKIEGCGCKDFGNLTYDEKTGRYSVSDENARKVF